MELWYPKAIKIKPDNFKHQLLTRFEKQVLHTTEARVYRPSTVSYYGHQLWPTATAANSQGTWRIFQHLPLNVMSAAMKNLAGGVETNRDGCVQIEIAWYAAECQLLPEAALICISEWLWWVHQQTDIPWRAVDTFHYYPPENNIKLGTEPWRLRGKNWDNYLGILGHQHADENVHGDPGKIDISYILGTHPPSFPIPPVTEEDMAIWRDAVDKVEEAFDVYGETPRDARPDIGSAITYYASRIAAKAKAGDEVGATAEYGLLVHDLQQEAESPLPVPDGS